MTMINDEVKSTIRNVLKDEQFLKMNNFMKLIK